MFDNPSQQLRDALEQVTSVTLPKIYREIGRRVAKSPKPPRGLEQHFQAITRLKPAAEAEDPVAVAALRAAYGALGKAAYELYGDKAVSKDVAPLLADALAKQQSYVESLSKQAPFIQPVTPVKRRSPPLLAYAALAIAVAMAAIAGYVTLPTVTRYAVSMRPTASAPKPAASRPSEPDRKDETQAPSGRRSPPQTSSPKSQPAAADSGSPDFESLVIAFSGEDAGRLAALVDPTLKPEAERARGTNPSPDLDVLADELIAEAATAIDAMSELDDAKAIQEAMERVAAKWSDGVRVLAVPLEDDPALRDVIESRVGGFLTYDLTQANDLVTEQYRRASSRVSEALTDAQKSTWLAFGGEDDLGRPFRRPEAQRKEMQGQALSRFKGAFNGSTKELAKRRMDAIRGIRGAQRKRSERLAECTEALRSEVTRAEREWRSRVNSAEKSLLRLMRDGEEFAAADSVAGFRKMSKDQQSRLAEVVSSESQGLATLWSSVVTDFVAGVTASKDIEGVADHASRAKQQVEARLRTAISALGRACDGVTSVFAARMDEERRRPSHSRNDRATSRLVESLLGHWIDEDGKTHYYFNGSTLVMIHPNRTAEMKVDVLEEDEASGMLKIAVSASGRHIKRLAFGGDRKTLVESAYVSEGDKPSQSKWRYIDGSRSPGSSAAIGGRPVTDEQVGQPSATGRPRAVPPAEPLGGVIPRRFFDAKVVRGLSTDQVHALLGPPDELSGSSTRVIWHYDRVKDETTGKGCAFVSFDRETGMAAGVGSAPNDRMGGRGR